MNWQMIKLDLRKVATGYFMFLVVFSAYVLFQPNPLKTADPFALVGGIGLGVFLAWRIFYDTPSTEAFLFSRPVSRRRFFRQRWLMGLFLQIATLIFIATLLSLGARCWIHFNGPYHPMVKWYELNVLKPIAVTSLPAYSVMSFFLLRYRMLRRKTESTLKRKILQTVPTVFLVGIFILFLLIVCRMPLDSMSGAIDGFMVLYGILLIALTTWASQDYFTKMEVRS
jgi:hypothetical protein